MSKSRIVGFVLNAARRAGQLEGLGTLRNIPEPLKQAAAPHIAHRPHYSNVKERPPAGPTVSCNHGGAARGEPQTRSARRTNLIAVIPTGLPRRIFRSGALRAR